VTTKAVQQAPAPVRATQNATALLRRHCACGTRTAGGEECSDCAEKKRVVQRRLATGMSHDPLEAEAHRVADALTGARSQRIGVHGRARADSSDFGSKPVPASVDRALESAGAPLPSRVRHDMERRFEQDFSHVRVHTDATAAQSARDIDADAYTAGRRIVFGQGRFAPETPHGRNLIAHELTHVVQQSSLGAQPAPIQRQPSGTTPTKAKPPAQPIEVEVVGADARVNESLAIMADRWAKDHAGVVVRVSSIGNMIDQLEKIAGSSRCIGKLVVWYHGSPELQLLVGEYELPPNNQRMPASSFSREWLQLDRNRPALERFRHLFCCGGTMQWIGCGTAMVRAAGGLRSPDEMQRQPALIHEHPDLYRSRRDALAHGAKLTGGSFGHINVQAWADATCTTITSATNLVTLDPKSPTPVTIDDGGTWTQVTPAFACQCDPATGRVGGSAPSRADLVRSWQKQIAAEVGGKGNVLWHEMVSALRTGLPRSTEIVGAGTTGQRTFAPQPGTLPDALRTEMKTRKGGKRGKLEEYYTTQLLFPLLKMAGEGLMPPNPLPQLPMPDHLFVRIAVGGSWAAVTQPHLVLANRADPWHWSVYNDQSIGETPEFTRTVIQHELEHAADYEKLLREFEKTRPPPKDPFPDKFSHPAEASDIAQWTGPWGVYINDFTAFTKTRIDPARHLEIIVGQRNQLDKRGGRSWNKWSAAERAYWFELAFHHLPPDVPAGTPIASEPEIMAAFTQSNDALKRAAIDRAADTIRNAICPWPKPNPDPLAKTPPKPLPKPDPAEVDRLRKNAKTLVRHFPDIIREVLDDRMNGAKRDDVLRLLSRPPPTQPGGLECNL
jgi:hypothetical protein